MEVIQLFVLIHVLHMLAGKNSKPMITEALNLKVINGINECKHPTNNCTSNTDDKRFCTVLIYLIISPLVNMF